ncbi:hypothetical protein HDU86_000181 [Geranomyces michiganensis]|nr:hypothetical protein HDU86_000181 [Geranomyces michiganensis]
MPPFTGDSSLSSSLPPPTSRRRAPPPTFIAIPSPPRHHTNYRINTIQLFTFRWHHSAAKNVILTGTFDNWSQSITLPRDPQCADEFCITLALDRLLRHEFKFVVDGEWRCSHAFKTTFDASGFVNNVIEELSREELAALAFDHDGGAPRYHVPQQQQQQQRPIAEGMMGGGKRSRHLDYLVGHSLAGLVPAAMAAKRSRIAY